MYHRYYYLDKMFSEIIVSNEKGIGANDHMHMYLKSKDKFLWKALRMFLYRLKVNNTSILREVKTAKSVRNWVKYITKEDANPRLHNIDKEQ